MRRLAALGAALLALAGCADPALTEYDARMERLNTIELEDVDVPMREPVEIAVPVLATTPATRVANAHLTGDTIPVPDPKVIVNALPYQHFNPEPARQAFYLMTSLRPCPRTRYIECWDRATQDAWWPHVNNVMLGESGYCPNPFRDAVFVSYSMCVIEHQGPHEDAGFGQATSDWHGRDGLSCKLEGLCGKHAIIASPWNSMLGSIIVPLEQDGSKPWCWDAEARDYHRTCYTAPDSYRY